MAKLLSCQDCLCFVRVINKNLFSFSLYTLNVGAIYVQAVTLKMSPKKLKRKHKLSLTNKYKSKRRKDSDHQSSDSETTQCSNNTDSKDTDSKDLFDEVHYFSVKKKTLANLKIFQNPAPRCCRLCILRFAIEFHYETVPADQILQCICHRRTAGKGPIQSAADQ